MKRMNLGCGPVQPDGWLNVDSDERWHALVASPARADWCRIPGDFDLIVANHVLQMVNWDELVPWLAAVRSKLRTGGVLRMLVPDAEAAFEAWLRGDSEWYPIADEHESGVDGKLCMYLTQAGATRSIFTKRWLLELCARAKYLSATEVEPGESTLPAEFGPCELDSRAGESIIVEARR